jgi:hypothetical protein
MKTLEELEGDESVVVSLFIQLSSIMALINQPGDCFVVCDAGGGTVVCQNP